LKTAGTHIMIDTLLGDELKKTVEFNQILGNKYLIVPGLAEERRNSRAAWAQTAKIFNEISEKVKSYNMFVGYHNHMIEFKPMDGECPWDTFYGTANKEVVMQLDLGNAMHGGVSAAELINILNRYPGRARTVHMKEFSSTGNKVVIVEGDVNWKEVIATCEFQGVTDWYIVEQESYAHPPMDCVKLCLENLKKLAV
jgi:sugar phosphate isomerase/epimerase